MVSSDWFKSDGIESLFPIFRIVIPGTGESRRAVEETEDTYLKSFHLVFVDRGQGSNISDLSCPNTN